MIGRIIGDKYEIVRVLQSGGMGVVCEAVHKATGKHVALKLIINEQTPRASLGETRDSQRELVVRFEREARAAGAIDTQHIVQVFDAGYDAACDMPFMVMELLLGEDVQQLIRRVGPVSPDAAMRIIAQAAIGLTKAHEAGVIHRDIKPANLFLTNRENGDVVLKVLDFGIAKMNRSSANEREATELTRTGSMLGSPQYMSPEQVHSDRSLDHRTDIWSLGVVLYKLLAGRSPHQEAGAMGSLLVAICTQPVKPIQDVAPWVPSEVAAIVHKALKIDRDERYATMGEMLEAVRGLLSTWHLHRDMLNPITDETRAQQAPRFVAAGDLTLMSSTSGAPSILPLHPSRRNQWAWTAALMLMVTLGVGSFAMRSHKPTLANGADASFGEDSSKHPAIRAPEPDPVIADTTPTILVSLHVGPIAKEVRIDGEVHSVVNGVVTFSAIPKTIHTMKIGSKGEKNIYVFPDGKIGDVSLATKDDAVHARSIDDTQRTVHHDAKSDKDDKSDHADKVVATPVLGFSPDFGEPAKK
jgi:serine/threonine protein kinase